MQITGGWPIALRPDATMRLSGELEAAVEENPYRERLWLLLIEALQAGFRRVEALRACARLRGILAEAGIQASDELAALEQRILEGHTASRPTTSGNDVQR